MTFIVCIDDYGGKKDIGKIFGRADVLTEARKIAYKVVKDEYGFVTIYDDSLVPYFTFIPTGQKLKSHLGEVIAEVHNIRNGNFAGKVFYYPNYHSEFYKKRNATHQKYILHKDGTLGKGGEW